MDVRFLFGEGSFADMRGPGWAQFPNLPSGPAGRVTCETLHRIPACITMHRRSPPDYRMSAAIRPLARSVLPPRLDHCPAAGRGWDISAVDSTTRQVSP
jgi:hypothetical protein